MKADGAKGHLDLLLLGVLAHGSGHGYAVITALRDRSDGVLDLSEGTVYPALHRLEADGLVASEWESVTGRRRRVYSITDTGAAALESRRRDWRAFARAVDAVLSRPAAAMGPA